MKFKLIVYGNLVSHGSLRRTIKDKKFTPVVVKGYKRIFNMEVGGRDYLNIKKSKDSVFNGVSFFVNENELERLKKREAGYVLKKANCYDYFTKEDLGKGYLFINYFDIDRKKKSPDKRYFNLCRKAAYKISRSFGKMWDETTFLSSGKKVSDIF